MQPRSRPCRQASHRFFFFNDTATTEIYTLSLHDALPISPDLEGTPFIQKLEVAGPGFINITIDPLYISCGVDLMRSEEHTSELQSQSNLVCRLLLEKKTTHRHRARLVTGRPTDHLSHTPD